MSSERGLSGRGGVALVTGATAGIGREFAVQLAARGNDLVLVARDRARLKHMTSDLHDRFGVQAASLVADLVDEAAIAAVQGRLRDNDAPVDLLVNNAGIGTYGNFAELDLAREEYEIELNVLAVVKLTHAALAGMVTRR